MSPILENLLVIRHDGLWQMTASRVANAEKLLERISDGRGTVIPNVATLNEKPISICSRRNGESITLGVELSQIEVQTWFRATSDLAAVTPSYRDAGTGQDLKQRRTWAIPPEFKFWFFYSQDPDDTMALAVLQHRESRVCYLPPISNIFPESKICMGAHWRPDRSAPLVERLVSAVSWFNQTEMNTDLIGGTGGGSERLKGSQLFLRWSLADESQMPVANMEEAIATLPRTSHHCWEALVTA